MYMRGGIWDHAHRCTVYPETVRPIPPASGRHRTVQHSFNIQGNGERGSLKMKWEWIEPPREATVEALYIWAQQLTEILNRMDTDKEETNGK